MSNESLVSRRQWAPVRSGGASGPQPLLCSCVPSTPGQQRPHATLTHIHASSSISAPASMFDSAFRLFPFQALIRCGQPARPPAGKSRMACERNMGERRVDAVPPRLSSHSFAYASRHTILSPPLHTCMNTHPSEDVACHGVGEARLAPALIPFSNGSTRRINRAPPSLSKETNHAPDHPPTFEGYMYEST